MEPIPFLEDVYPRNLMYAVTIRSPIAKGQLFSVQAPQLPGGCILITAKDIPGKNILDGTDVPVLADKKLSYIGEPVAIMLGHDKTKLEELASRCKVIFEEEEPVFSGKDEKAQAVIEREITAGSTQEVFEYSGTLVIGTYNTGIQEHFYAEPIGAVTWYNDEDDPVQSGRLKVRTATQWPHHVKYSVAGVLGIDSAEVTVEPTVLNLHMDGKLWYPSLIACHAALGTFIAKKPVRLILNREDDFLYTPKRFSSEIDIFSSVDKNGDILATNINISVNLGAYPVNEKEILDNICLGCLGFYNFNNLVLTAKTYRTNIPPQGAFSGFGLAQGLFAVEQHVSQVADISGIDPAVWKLKNADHKNIIPSTQQKTSVSCEDLISAAAKHSDYYRKWTSNELLRQSRKNKPGSAQESGRTGYFAGGDNPRGIGIALGYQSSGLLYPLYDDDRGNFSVEITLTKDSILEIKTCITTPEDYSKIWEKIVFETLSINPDMIRVDAINAPDCGPSCASRNITAVTRLVEKCCNAIKKQRFHDPLPITVRRTAKPQAGSLRGLEVPDVKGFTRPGLAAAVVEVAIDLAECVPIIRGIWLAIDGGRIMSFNRARRSVKRSATQALGWAFTECLEYINGEIPKSQYSNFSIFSPIEIPPVHIDFLDCDSGDPKGIGDLPFTCIPAAFTQAVSQAMDHSFKSIPLKRNEIWEMFKARYEKIPEPGHK